MIFRSLFLLFLCVASGFANEHLPPFSEWELVSFNVSWLYWKVNGDDFDYAVDKKVSNQRRSLDFLKYSGPKSIESFHDLKFDWDSGFRLGFDVDACECWQFRCEWTHFDTSSHKHMNVNGLRNGLSSVAFPVLDGNYSSVPLTNELSRAFFKGSLNFRYNIIDLEMGQYLDFCDCVFRFRPHIGLRMGEIQEKFKDRFEPNTRDSLETKFDFYRFSSKNRFQGAGVRVGFDADVYLCEGWTLIGKGAGSLLWGNTKVKNHFSLEAFDTLIAGNKEIDSDFQIESLMKEHYRQTKAIADLSLGLRYDDCFCDCYLVALEILWEHHLLFNQNRFFIDDGEPLFLPLEQEFENPKATTSWKKKGTLALQGWTFNVEVQF